MTADNDPVFARLAAVLTAPFEFGQLRLTPAHPGFEVRHAADLGRPEAELTELSLAGLIEWAQVDGRGAFRPNKAAPNLRTGWRFFAADLLELVDALRRVYPGALADWNAESAGAVGVELQSYLGRQTGIYRAARDLTVVGAHDLVAATCGPAFCLRRRLWYGLGIEVEQAAPGKSTVPCFEPCGLALEMARRLAKSSPASLATVQIHLDDLAAALAALEVAAALGRFDVREGDLGEPGNPRRARLAATRLRRAEPSVRP